MRHSTRLAWGLTVVTATLLAVTLIVIGRQNETVLESVAVGPGSSLELQTSQGPMTLTVDSPINAAGYVHAYGMKNGVEYAGYVKLSSAAQQLPQPSLAQQYSPIPSARVVQEVAGAGPIPQGAYLSLNIEPDGSAVIDGERALPVNSRTASILRLLAKKSSPAITFMTSNAGATSRTESLLDNEISRAKQLVSKLEAVKQSRLSGNARPTMLSMTDSSSRRSRHHSSSLSRKSMYAMMQTLMHSVSKIERKEDSMSTVVDKVKKIMRYKPF